MKILVLGFGPHGSGIDAAEYYKSYGHDVTLMDSSDKELVANLHDKLSSLGVNVISGEITAKDIKTYDIVVKAPTIPLSQSILRSANEITNDLAALLKDDKIEKIQVKLNLSRDTYNKHKKKDLCIYCVSSFIKQKENKQEEAVIFDYNKVFELLKRSPNTRKWLMQSLDWVDFSF